MIRVLNESRFGHVYPAQGPFPQIYHVNLAPFKGNEQYLKYLV